VPSKNRCTNNFLNAKNPASAGFFYDCLFCHHLPWCSARHVIIAAQ